MNNGVTIKSLKELLFPLKSISYLLLLLILPWQKTKYLDQASKYWITKVVTLHWRMQDNYLYCHWRPICADGTNRGFDDDWNICNSTKKISSSVILWNSSLIYQMFMTFRISLMYWVRSWTQWSLCIPSY